MWRGGGGRGPAGGAGVALEGGMVLVRGGGGLGGGGVKVDGVIRDGGVGLGAVPGVGGVDRPADLAKHDTTVAVVRRWVHQVPLDAGVELVATLKPYCIWVYANLPPIAAHGQPSDIDAHVPLILWGRALRRGVYQARVASVDIEIGRAHV